MSGLRTFCLKLIAIMLLVVAVPSPIAQAQDFPGSPFPADTNLGLLAYGQLSESLGLQPHFVFDRIVVASGETLSEPFGPQLLMVDRGRIEATDQDGVVASIGPGVSYADLDAERDTIRATEASIVFRASITVDRESTDTEPTPSDPTPTIAITDEGCSPTSITLGQTRELGIANRTNNPHTVTIEGVELQATVRPGHRETIDLTDVPPGNWTLNCPFAYGDPDAVDTITITIANPDPATPVPSSVQLADPLFDVPFDGDIDSPVTFYMGSTFLLGEESIGELNFSGPAVVYSDSAALNITRAGYLATSVPAQTAQLIIPNSKTEIVNAGTHFTTVFVVGLSNLNPDGSPSTEDDRPPYRNTPEPSPTETSGDDSSAGDLDALSTFLPDRDQLKEVGYNYLYTQKTADIESSFYWDYARYYGDPGWLAGINATYLGDPGDNRDVTILVDRFETAEAASEVARTTQENLYATGNTETAPLSPNAGRTFAASVQLLDPAINLTYVFGLYGDVIVILLVAGPPDADTAAPIYDIWDLIDASQD